MASHRNLGAVYKKVYNLPWLVRSGETVPKGWRNFASRIQITTLVSINSEAGGTFTPINLE